MGGDMLSKSLIQFSVDGWSCVPSPLRRNLKEMFLFLNKNLLTNLVILRHLWWETFLLLDISSVPQSCLTLCNPMYCSTPGFLVHHRLPELTQTHIHQIGDAIQPSHPLSSPSPPAFNLSQHQNLSQLVGCLHRVTKYWNFTFSVCPSNEYSGLISFRIDWLKLLAVQGSFKCIL